MTKRNGYCEWKPRERNSMCPNFNGIWAACRFYFTQQMCVRSLLTFRHSSDARAHVHVRKKIKYIYLYRNYGAKMILQRFNCYSLLCGYIIRFSFYELKWSSIGTKKNFFFWFGHCCYSLIRTRSASKTNSNELKITHTQIHSIHTHVDARKCFFLYAQTEKKKWKWKISAIFFFFRSLRLQLVQ